MPPAAGMLPPPHDTIVPPPAVLVLVPPHAAMLLEPSLDVRLPMMFLFLFCTMRRKKAMMGSSSSIGIRAAVLPIVKALEQPRRQEQVPPSLYHWTIESPFKGLIRRGNSEREMIRSGAFTMADTSSISAKCWSLSAVV